MTSKKTWPELCRRYLTTLAKYENDGVNFVNDHPQSTTKMMAMMTAVCLRFNDAVPHEAQQRLIRALRDVDLTEVREIVDEILDEGDDLGTALDSYTDPTHPEYDAEFDAKIRRLRPDWFDNVN